MQQLIHLYERQLEHLKELLEIAREKQRTLIASDSDKFSGVIAREEQVLSIVRVGEQNRLQVIAKVQQELYPGQDKRIKLKLSEMLTNQLAPQELMQLRRLEAETRDLVLQISRVNEQNLFLISHLRKYYTDTINNIMALQNKQTFVDRRV